MRFDDAGNLGQGRQAVALYGFEVSQKKMRTRRDCQAGLDCGLAEIQPIEILNVLRYVERKGNLETTHRLRLFCSRVFKYGVCTARNQTDPAALLTGALRTPKTKHHAAILDPAGVGALLRALDAFDGFQARLERP